VVLQCMLASGSVVSVVCSDAPRLNDLSVNDEEDFDTLLKSFVCHSMPVASKARRDHVSELRLLDQPWWRKLADEYHDSKYILYDDNDDDDTSWKVF